MKYLVFNVVEGHLAVARIEAGSMEEAVLKRRSDIDQRSEVVAIAMMPGNRGEWLRQVDFVVPLEPQVNIKDRYDA